MMGWNEQVALCEREAVKGQLHQEFIDDHDDIPSETMAPN